MTSVVVVSVGEPVQPVITEPGGGCISIGIGSLDDPAASPYDVVVESGSDPAVALIEERTARNPLAALALVQLLRLSESLSVDDAVIAESFVYSMLQSGPEFAAWLEARGPRTPFAAPEPVMIDRAGDTLSMTLNRPEKRNAYNAAIREGLLDGFDIFEADDSLTSVVVAGNGPSFSAGGDLDEFGTFSDPASAHVLRTSRHVGRRIARYPTSVSFRVHGACIGAGCELPAFSSTVTAASDAFFALPEVAMGLVPGAGGTASLPRRIGRQRTAWMALTGLRVDAPTALAWGLVDRVV
ncbi:MAG: enoyl-CoA hydratase/isomerase family protein [Acidimicrobiia bacterium]